MIQKEFVNDGFAIWLTGDVMETDIHINEWLLPPNNNFIDFGIRIYEVSKVTNINVFIPFDIKLSDIEDLSYKLSNENIARGIFNTLCTIKTSSSNPMIEIDYNNRKENILGLSFVEIIIKNISYGTIVTFDINNIKKDLTTDEGYLRFRIPHKSINNLFKSRKKYIRSLIETPVIKYQYNYTLKINEVRSLPIEVRSISQFSQQNIKKIIVTVSVSEKYDIDDNEAYKVRQLEEELYTNYVPKKFSCKNIIMYQWIKNHRKDYNYNFKIFEEEISITSLLEYACIVIILAVLGNILWEVIKHVIS